MITATATTTTVAINDDIYDWYDEYEYEYAYEYKIIDLPKTMSIVIMNPSAYVDVLRQNGDFQ